MSQSTSVGFDGGRPSKWSTRLTTVGVRVRPVSSARVSRALLMTCWRRATYKQFHRLRTRRGAKKAIGAVAASILTAVYHMLKDSTLYQDLGPDHFDPRDRPRPVQAELPLGE